MTEISMVVTSIDSWPPLRFSDDQVLELVTITAVFENGSEGAAAGKAWVQIVESQELAKDQAPSGYLIDNRQVQMTFAKSVEVRVGDRIKFRIVS
jgi:hypothetical protein